MRSKSTWRRRKKRQAKRAAHRRIVLAGAAAVVGGVDAEGAAKVATLPLAQPRTSSHPRRRAKASLQNSPTWRTSLNRKYPGRLATGSAAGGVEDAASRPPRMQVSPKSSRTAHR